MKKINSKYKCQLKGPLQFLVLWIIYKNPSKGCEVISELEKRRGAKPSPGTVYPLLKDLVEKDLLSLGDGFCYKITKKGERYVVTGCRRFVKIFYDFEEIKKVK